MFYAVVDGFEQVLGGCHPDLAAAEAAITQFGENSGSVIVVELNASLEDMSLINDNPDAVTGKAWKYNFLEEKFEAFALSDKT
jgi:hypothetical protein